MDPKPGNPRQSDACYGRDFTMLHASATDSMPIQAVFDSLFHFHPLLSVRFKRHDLVSEHEKAMQKTALNCHNLT